MIASSRPCTVGDPAGLANLPDDWLAPLAAIVAGELPFTACSLLPGRPEVVAELVAARWVIVWPRNGGDSATLTPWAAERLRVEIDEGFEVATPRWVSWPQPATDAEAAALADRGLRPAGLSHPVRAARDPVAGVRLPRWLAELIPAPLPLAEVLDGVAAVQTNAEGREVLVDDTGRVVLVMGVPVVIDGPRGKGERHGRIPRRGKNRAAPH